MNIIKTLSRVGGIATWVAWIIMGVLILRKREPVNYITYGCAWFVAVYFMGLYWFVLSIK